MYRIASVCANGLALLLHLFSSALHVHMPTSVVLTVGHGVAGDPLVAAVFSSLNLDVCNSDLSAKIHLQPLVSVVDFCGPSAPPTSCSLEIQSGVDGAVISVPLGGSRNPRIWNNLAFHSQLLDSAV